MSEKKQRAHIFYLEDMLDAMHRISEYLEGYVYDDFINDQKTVDAVVRNFEIIGEAAKNVPENIRRRQPDVPWAEMYVMRNIVSHQYFGIDYGIIWDVAVNHLPENRRQVQRLLDELIDR